MGLMGKSGLIYYKQDLLIEHFVLGSTDQQVGNAVLAVDLVFLTIANNPGKLSELNSKPRQIMADSPVCDARKFANNFTRIMREI